MGPLITNCNNLYSVGAVPKSWLEYRIIVIPKKDKDSTKVESYGPISLLNHDAKIFTIIMAKHLNTFIGDYIHINQSGFIPS